jgi:predicted CXXCH cytochrome family protein
MRRLNLSRATTIALGIALIVVSSGAFSLARRVADDIAFPHARHARLFPTCAGCHSGIPTSDSATFFPPAQACAECHNDRDVKVVAWNAPHPRPTNLRFDHARHLRLTDSSGTRVDCARCHGDGPSTTTMQIVQPRPARCLGCHRHEAPSHFAPTSPCATCHVPLARASSLGDSAIAALPKPPSHGAPDFVSAHGALASSQAQSCATCHTRESCARCHLNASTLPAIRSLGESPRMMRLVSGKPAAYTAPASHSRSDFAAVHGSLARANVQSCATCHAQASCRTCHTGTLGASTIGALSKGNAGVRLHAPARVHAPDFTRSHGPVAATGRLDCAGCHQQSFCAGCHQGSGQRRFHPNNFVARHPSEAYARETKCASCHNTEVFCRSCHRDVVGIGAGSKRRAGAAHAGQPLWLLQHGEAARKGMEGCAACHQQTDCLQCHSAYGSRINPHGPGFNAEAMRKRNPTLCSYCHIKPPS